MISACDISTELLMTTNKASKKKNRSIVVTCVLLVSFAIGIANLAIQWKTMTFCFIDNGQSMLSAFICSLNLNESGYALAILISNNMQNVIADILVVMSILSNTFQ